MRRKATAAPKTRGRPRAITPFVQITVTHTPNYDDSDMFALDAGGRVWMYHWTDRTWHALSAERETS